MLAAMTLVAAVTDALLAILRGHVFNGPSLNYWDGASGFFAVHCSRRQIWRFAILTFFLALSALTTPAGHRLLILSQTAFLAAGIEAGLACLRRDRVNGESLNHWDAAAALAGVSSFALGIS